MAVSEMPEGTQVLAPSAGFVRNGTAVSLAGQSAKP
jgi:hypothetical protein